MASLGHPSKFQPVLHLAFITAPTSLNEGQQNFAGSLAYLWPSPGVMHYIYIFGGSCPDRILSRATFTLRPSLAFSCICSATARHLSSGRQPNFVAWYRGRHLYSAGWPSAHILVSLVLTLSTDGGFLAGLGIQICGLRFSLDELNYMYLSPYGIGQTIIFSCCGLFFFFFFPRLISAAADWMSAILPHMVWP